MSAIYTFRCVRTTSVPGLVIGRCTAAPATVTHLDEVRLLVDGHKADLAAAADLRAHVPQVRLQIRLCLLDRHLRRIEFRIHPLPTTRGMIIGNSLDGPSCTNTR